MLRAAVRIVSEHGYQKMSVGRVAGGARVSRRTFYDVFTDREDCFLAIFQDAVERAGARVRGAYESTEDVNEDWCGRVRAALSELLVFFDEEPRVASLLVVDALAAGPRVLSRRADVLKGLSARLHRDGSRAGNASRIAPLTGEGVIGGVLSVIHTRLSQKDPVRTLGLLNPLMGMIVLPYLGQAAAQRELGRPAPKSVRSVGLGRRASRKGPSESDPLAELPMRITYRTLRVLGAIAAHSGASNRTIGEAADTFDQGQISKLLARLEGLGLIENASGNDHKPTGEPNAWSLTARGEDVERSLLSLSPTNRGVVPSSSEETGR
jgi:AcrR family transcriptional regulator/DNA-binding MarR family transcriptional regulator